MKQIRSLSSFNVQKLDANQCRLVIGGVAADTSSSFTVRKETKPPNGCSDENAVTQTTDDNGKVTTTTSSETCCPN